MAALRVLLFGASGMVGQGVLRECLLDPEVSEVVSVARSAGARPHPKLREVVHRDFLDYRGIADRLGGFDACFWCLGVSSVGMSETDYTRVTHDYTIAAAEAILPRNPALTFVFVSGQGTDSSERGRTMWARVKGRTENDLLKLPFRAAYMFRPGMIQPMHGITSRTTLYRVLYVGLAPFVPLLRRAFPKFVTTTEILGRAMLAVARQGYAKRILECADINAAGGT